MRKYFLVIKRGDKDGKDVTTTVYGFTDTDSIKMG